MSKTVYWVSPSPLLHQPTTLPIRTPMPPSPFSPTIITEKAEITHYCKVKVLKAKHAIKN